jgi:hypothetical protein
MATCKHIDVTCYIRLTGYMRNAILSNMKPTFFLTSAKAFLSCATLPVSVLGQLSPAPDLAPMQPQPPRIVLPNDSRQTAIENLRALNVHPGYEEKLRTFGQFIGVWDMDIKLFNEANQIVYHQPGVWMFSWILDGRAIQDVIVGPPKSDPAHGERRIGTTIRYYDETTKRWHITFITATGQIYIHLEGGQKGDVIVLEGKDMDGSALRWMFTEITQESFHWLGYTSPDSGKTWRLEQEMLAKRRAPVKTGERSAWWRRNDLKGLESARLRRTHDGWLLSGTSAFQHAGSSCLLNYEVHCDEDWRTRLVLVEGWADQRSVHHQIMVKPNGRWIRNGTELPQLDGCIDIDLNFSPSTNTLPIRRLHLAVGASARVRAAWLRFPDFTLHVAEQSYTRIATDRYEYRNGKFRSEISVDSTGLVRDYSPVWEPLTNAASERAIAANETCARTRS